MRKTNHLETAHTADSAQAASAYALPANSGLPNRLLTAFEVAEFVGCHEETVRRAYLRGLLVSQRFGVRGRRFHPREDLRHEGACRLLSDGVDIRIIQLMLGHASVQQTQRYLNVTDEELRKGFGGQLAATVAEGRRGRPQCLTICHTAVTPSA